MIRKEIFLLIVFITNIIQGITGFAGTVLAMPPSVIDIGFNTAKPILNLLGIFAGIYVVAISYRHIDKKEFLKCMGVMAVGIVAGIFLKSLFTGNAGVLYKILGCVVMLVGLSGVYKTFFKKDSIEKPHNPFVSYLLLVSSGVVHGMFVCGGPLLVSYLTGKLKDKQTFRATISAIWIVLNSIILVSDVRDGYFTRDTLTLAAAASVVLFLGIAVGNILYKKMSREVFMKITYILLVISGASLFIK